MECPEKGKLSSSQRPQFATRYPSGGRLPDDKHTLLAKWLGGTRNAREKWPERIYIDPFCGPGRIQVEGESFRR